MIEFIMNCGIFVWPLAVLAVFIVVLSARESADLFIRRRVTDLKRPGRLDAILFWGALSAALGILGQAVGIYHSFNAISGKIADIPPTTIAMGIADSFATTIFGLANLAVSALIWFGLRSRHRRIMIQVGR